MEEESTDFTRLTNLRRKSRLVVTLFQVNLPLSVCESKTVLGNHDDINFYSTVLHSAG